jgi:hypothetical protein
MVLTEGDKGAANPIQGKLLVHTGTTEVGFDLTNYTGTFTLWRVYYRGSITSDPSNTGSSTMIDTKASFLADEHNSRRIVFMTGRDEGSTYSVSDTASGTTLTIASNVYAQNVRTGDEFMVYAIKVSGSAVSITGATDGEFQYNPGSSDLDEVGEYLGEFRFSNTSTANKVIHFPIGEAAKYKIRIRVAKALNI